MLQEFPDGHASWRFRRVATPELVNIIIGDLIAQQAGRYELPAADTAIRQHANLNESSTSAEKNETTFRERP